MRQHRVLHQAKGRVRRNRPIKWQENKTARHRYGPGAESVISAKNDDQITVRLSGRSNEESNAWLRRTKSVAQ
jgi:hypothetical protein